jgi:hypothetical protein
MPTAMTYTSLLADLRAYLERGATTDPIVFNQLPQLVGLAQDRIITELKIQGFTAVVTSVMQAGVAVIPKPNRWKETISMNFGTGTGNNVRTILKGRSYEYCRDYWPNDTVTGVPVYYADYNFENWLIAPTPAAAYPFEVLYYGKLEELDDTVQTNWLTENAPNLILYASLLEATPFLKNDQRIPVWQSMYDRYASALSGEELRKILDRTNERTA